MVALFALVLILSRNPTVGRSYDTIQIACVCVRPPPPPTNGKPYVRGRQLVYLQSLDKLVSSSVNVLDAETGHRRHSVVTSSSRTSRRSIVPRTTTFDCKGTQTVRARTSRPGYGHRYRKRVHAGRRCGPARSRERGNATGTPADTAGEPQT